MNLYVNAKPYEVFHLQTAQPTPHWIGVRWLVRRTWWTDIYKPDGSKAKFTSWVFLWFFQVYHGTAKCDATRTYMYRTGQLGEPYDNFGYIMTTTPKEMLAVRFRKNGMDKTPIWTDMGGC